MTPPSNTPPDGDFAAYVERLTHARGVPAPREDMIGNRAVSPLGTPFAAASGPSQPPHLPWSASAIFSHLKWIALIWTASLLLGRVVPGAGFLLIPAFAGYATWAYLRHNRNKQNNQQLPGGMAQRLRELAGQALAEVNRAGQPKGK